MDETTNRWVLFIFNWTDDISLFRDHHFIFIHKNDVKNGLSSYLRVLQTCCNLNLGIQCSSRRCLVRVYLYTHGSSNATFRPKLQIFLIMQFKQDSLFIFIYFRRNLSNQCSLSNAIHELTEI